MKAFSVGTLSLCNNGILRFFMVVTQGTKDIKKNTFKEFRVLEVLERSEKKKKAMCCGMYKESFEHREGST